MPIEQLSAERRLARDFKVRLGTRIVKRTRETAGRDEARGPGEAYPKETDYFVLEEAPEEVKALYKEKPRSLRIMLGFEWNQQSPSGDDLVYSLYNRAYGASKGLKCRGTGRSAEFFGVARTSDKEWALRIEKATGFAPEAYEAPSGETYYNIRCFGRDCPKFLHRVRVPDPENPAREIDQLAPNHDRDASCNDVAILRCFLLHPTTDAKDEIDYCRTLGVMELATGSINSIIDLQSGFDLLKPFTGGRTAGIPLTLTRHMITTYRGAKASHWPCKISFDHREIQRWAAIPLNEVFLTETQRTILKQLQETPLGLSVDSVRDLIPRSLPSGLGNGAATGQATAPPEPATTATSEVVPEGVSEPPDVLLDPADTPFLVADQLDRLKTMAGGPVDPNKPADKFTNPWKPAALDRLRGAVVAMREAMGITEPMSLSDLRVGHYEWLKERLQSLPPLEGEA